MKLIFDIDSNSSIEKVDELNETTGQVEKKYKIKGIFSTINTKNRNGRIYPEKLWKLANHYYHTNKAWIPEKNLEKLKTFVNQQKERERFVSNVF